MMDDDDDVDGRDSNFNNAYFNTDTDTTDILDSKFLDKSFYYACEHLKIK